eukprot:m.339219 g.339219  ORF g.339219 m.339219 type:complete len:249 (-) comp20578_c0_seq5:2133-2879(-)
MEDKNEFGASEGPSSSGEDSLQSKITREVGENIAKNALKAGSEKAKSLFDSYTKVDVLRPYFDVEPSAVRTQLIRSLYPRLKKDCQELPKDLYGPTMLAFTLSAVLLILMKTGVGADDAIVVSAEGTIMGRSFASSFGYWFTFSAILYSVGFIFNTELTGCEILSLTGYGLFSYCLCLLVTTTASLWSPYKAFNILWGTVGLLSSTRIGLGLRAQTKDIKQGTILGVLGFAIHWLWLLRLHKAYVGAG